jgi:hypothetical protein
LTPGFWTFLLATNLTEEHALKARSISAQGSTLGKPALLGSGALQGRRAPRSLGGAATQIQSPRPETARNGTRLSKKTLKMLDLAEFAGARPPQDFVGQPMKP